MSAPDIEELKRRFEEVFGRPPRDFSETQPTYAETITSMPFLKKINTLDRKLGTLNVKLSIVQDFIKTGDKDFAKKVISKDNFIENMTNIKFICQSIITDNEDKITSDLVTTFKRFFSLYDAWRKKYLQGEFSVMPKCITAKKDSACSIMGGKTRRRKHSNKSRKRSTRARSTRKRRAGKKSRSGSRKTFVRGRRSRK